MINDSDTHNAGVAGADVIVRLHWVPDTEVVGLLLQLGQVESPGLLPAEVHLTRGHSLGHLAPPPEGAAEHRNILLKIEFLDILPFVNHYWAKRASVAIGAHEALTFL